MNKFNATLGSIILCLSASISTSVFAEDPLEDSSAQLQWTGKVPGAFNGKDIGLTGQNGSEIVDGQLKISEDGSFTTPVPVIVEARAMEANGVDVDKTKFYAGDINWTVQSLTVDHDAYVTTDLTVSINGTETDVDSTITTSGRHSLSISVESKAPSAPGKAVKPGDEIVVTALIYAEAKVL
tara:strand:- start:2971 stop:3516 length:546 start_codon:yes stop_codon:yes gene_type:complete